MHCSMTSFRAVVLHIVPSSNRIWPNSDGLIQHELNISIVIIGLTFGYFLYLGLSIVEGKRYMMIVMIPCGHSCWLRGQANEYHP